MLIGLAVCLVLIIAFLAIPVSMTYKVTWLQAFQGSIKLQWLFGLVCVRIPISQSRPQGLSADDIDLDQVIKSGNRPARKKKQNYLAVIRKSEFRRRVMRFVRDLWRAIHKRNMKLRIRIGLGDPADTGQLWAFVGPVSVMAANVQEASIEIQPDFTENMFELNSSGDIRLIPLQIISLAVGLLLSPPVWKGIKQMRNAE